MGDPQLRLFNIQINITVMWQLSRPKTNLNPKVNKQAVYLLWQARMNRTQTTSRRGHQICYFFTLTIWVGNLPQLLLFMPIAIVCSTQSSFHQLFAEDENFQRMVLSQWFVRMETNDGNTDKQKIGNTSFLIYSDFLLDKQIK